MLLWNPVPIPVFNPSTGDREAGAKAYFYVGGTGTPQSVFSTDDGAAPLPFPVVADANGVFPPVFIPYGPFGFRVTTASGSAISPNVLTVQNPAPPDSGGGGGIVVTADQVLQVGDPIWRLRSGTMSGFVRMNDKTVGSTGSGATERANADTQALFSFLWENCSDAIAPVAGGRGATAGADFSANKTIGVPTMQGYLAAGLDDMGGTVANRIQASTTITTTNTITTATVASIAGLAIGMRVATANFATGTTITDISGTTLTFSSPATLTASGTPARFSAFTDAQLVGSTGGVTSRSQLQKEMAIHDHGGVVAPGGAHTHDLTAAVSNGVAVQNGSGGGFGTSGNQTITTSPSGSHSHLIPPAGSGLPMSIQNPARLGTWFMKL